MIWIMNRQIYKGGF